MTVGPRLYDVVVIGSGPAGQKAAIQAAKAGRRVAVVEKDAAVGGACVRHGTIPSKTLRETTLVLSTFRRRSGDVLPLSLPESLTVASLMTRLDDVVRGHHAYIGDQLRRNGIDVVHGRARFLSPREIEVLGVDGRRCPLRADLIVIAVGSRPRTPATVPVDHETILDSDSILSLIYLPSSMIVLGGGVVASEYASIFAALGVRVTMIDRGTRPVAFLDAELTDRFVRQFERSGGRFIGGARVAAVATDGFSVRTALESGETLTADKMLCALGRVAAVDRLDLGAAGLTTDERGFLRVDEHCRTAVPQIYAVGDVTGPPALAASAMEQGRRAMCHALGLAPGAPPETTPVGIYTIPEMASVGFTEHDARKLAGGAVVGRADFREIARGHIVATQDGFLKMVADPQGHRLLGVQIIGEGATELIHMGQLAMVFGGTVDAFVENVFNFPTLAEAYRVAALEIVRTRARARPGENVVGPAPPQETLALPAATVAVAPE
jgi:NAD(P) transhydrogenase